jgi:hypothetical protein
MAAETPKSNPVDTESPAERESAYAEFRSSLAERLIAQDERTLTYLNVRQLGELLDNGELGYIEAEMSEDSQSGDNKIDKISVMIPDPRTGDYNEGAVIYEADLPFGEVRKLEQRKNLSAVEAQRAEERSKTANSMAVATESTIQMARAGILADKPEGYAGEPATAAEIRQLFGRLPK